jgi:hypothetical protein
MKYINKLFLVLLAFSILNACEVTELDLLDDPNRVPPEQANVDDLFNAVQIGFRDAFQTGQFNPGAAARMYHFTGAGTYEDFVTEDLMGAFWIDVYSGNQNTNLGDPGLFPDVLALLNIAEPIGLNIHVGAAKILKAYMLVALADIFGEAPNSQALQGIDNIAPAYDSGEELYAAATALLDEAIATLGQPISATPDYEGFYDSDPEKWIKAANSIKLKMALNTGDAGTITSIVNSGNFIETIEDDLQFNYGNQRINPNSRHPFYELHYELGDGDYLSNYFMWLLAGDKVTEAGVTITDPRIRYYFYRKIEDSEAQDQTTYGCQYSIFPDQAFKPAHWEATSPNVPYCVIPGTGYSGRDHLNPQGIPPDGNLRTSYGLYPGGGQFDDSSFKDTRQGGSTGGQGEGIWPVLISPMVDLMRAEAALTLGTGEDARMLLEQGIRESIAKAVSFESLVEGTLSTEVELRNGDTGTIRELFGTDEDDVNQYVENVLALYDAADDDGKLDLVAKEMMIASWGNGIEAYNLYRRTGKPNNMQPALEPAFGVFPRTFLYPTVSVQRNQSVSQKERNATTFWDDGTIDLY